MLQRKIEKNVFKAFILLMNNAKPYAKALSFAIVGLLITRLSEGVIYKFLLPQTLDAGFIAKETQFLTYMPLFIVGVFISLGCGEFIAKFMMGYVGRSVVRDYRVQMLNHLLEVPVNYYQQQTSGAVSYTHLTLPTKA